MSRYNHNEQDRVTGKAHLVTSLLAKADECNKALWTTFVCNEKFKKEVRQCEASGLPLLNIPLFTSHLIEKKKKRKKTEKSVGASTALAYTNNSTFHLFHSVREVCWAKDSDVFSRKYSWNFLGKKK